MWYKLNRVIIPHQCSSTKAEARQEAEKVLWLREIKEDKISLRVFLINLSRGGSSIFRVKLSFVQNDAIVVSRGFCEFGDFGDRFWVLC